MNIKTFLKRNFFERKDPGIVPFTKIYSPNFINFDPRENYSLQSNLINFSNHTPHEECPNTELFLIRIFPHLDSIQRDAKYLSVFSPNAGKYGPDINSYANTFYAVFSI